MKKTYIKPFAEMVEFETKESILADVDIDIGGGDSGNGNISGGYDDDWFWD